MWTLDANNTKVIDSGDEVFAYAGLRGDVPIVGDWKGAGRTNPGIFRAGYFWILDTNGVRGLAKPSRSVASPAISL